MSPLDGGGVQGKSTACEKAQGWDGIKVMWAKLWGREGCREYLTLSDMEHCRILSQREEFCIKTRIWGKSNQKSVERWN